MNNFNKVFLILLFFSILGCSLELFSQRGMIIPDSISGNFHKEVELREKYWDTVGVDKRKGEFKQFNRWKAFWEMRVKPDGSYPKPELILDAFNIANTHEKKNKESFQSMPTWKELGPIENPKGALTDGGVGRINIVRFNPNNSQEIYVGTANGGAWKSTNSGASWLPLYQTEFLSLGVSDIAISSSNPNILYCATGDNDGSLSGTVAYSIGILKSTDGGVTWKTTGNISTLNENRIITRLWVHPTDDKIVIAGTSNGIIKSTDGGATWKSVFSSGKIFDIEQMPNNPNTLYGSSLATIYRSDDMGETWKSLYTLQGGRRTCIEVTPAAPNNIYAMTANSEGGFLGLITSTDKGETWEQTNIFSVEKANNYLCWYFFADPDPNSIMDMDNMRGQGYYDLAMAVSPTNANTIFIGGVNIWKSTDKGKSFSPSAFWTYSSNVPYVHADIHDLKFVGNDLYATHDGGIDVTKNLGTSWNQIYKGLGIGQIYHFNTSPHNPDKILIGCQDLGSRLRDADLNWYNVGGGDGMGCVFDPLNENRYYYSTYYGDVRRVYNGEVQGILNSKIIYSLFGIADTSTWTTNIAVSQQSGRIYVGYANIYSSDNNGNNWNKQTNWSYSSSNTIKNIKVNKKNDNYVYAHTLQTVYYTNNAGSKWNIIYPEFGGQNISYITPHPMNLKMFYVTYSGYTDGYKLFKYDGEKWINLSGNLPNVPANCVEIQFENGVEKIYVGTDIGVYYGLESAPHYIRWGTNLPNTSIIEMEIIPSKNLLRAATYGRGVWETDINSCVVENFTIKIDGDTAICNGDSVKLYVETPNQNNVVWSTGETGNEIWAKNGGNYFAVSNTNTECLNPSNSIDITIKQRAILRISNSGTTEMCEGDSVTLNASPLFVADSYKWNTGDTGRTIVVKKAGNYVVSALNQSGCTSISDTLLINTYPKPAVPTVTYIAADITDPPAKIYDTLEASEGIKYQWYKDNIAISNADSKRLVLLRDVSSNGKYTVSVSNEGDCFSEQSDLYDYTSIEEEVERIINISPNPAYNTININLPEQYYGEYIATIIDINGKNVKEYKINFDGTIATLEINSLSSGTYVLKLESNKHSISRTFVKSDK